MHESTLKPLLTICEKVLVENHLEAFYGELKNLLVSDPQNSIGRLLKLVYRSNCEPERLKALFEEQVEAGGQASIEKVADKAFSGPDAVRGHLVRGVQKVHYANFL
ncbi:hypothetical protein HPB48_018141 [Haemaphysalis longicornis]|uniref:Cullin N-terminal domain-containing protein n=1 Tax=Haemaphysalis longicornis TaxID=44386 RepID=A0A9J6FWE5_HAELO|nr:hypothetical protein HPB48_018141 [Haemaphysalis longicornis]